eukprot:CAMPEP_0114295060 /NCGR_PEP_ID=MMETSP0059-20121206/10469_1 /TAXON_ID=36894 /ORGANISM="Pyramimonas parkeae, Strain CCMP726" /LENGTH=182 /DNA_ID=CAMNT_0001416901 /DNA_START=237 /DNA_END=785 /DNA_ORIENTATION=+
MGKSATIKVASEGHGRKRANFDLRVPEPVSSSPGEELDLGLASKAEQRRTLPWIILGVTVMFLGYQQVRLSSLSAILQEKDTGCDCGGNARGNAAVNREDDSIADDHTAVSMSVEEELDALYKQLNEQAQQLQAMHQLKLSLETRRDTSVLSVAPKEPPTSREKCFLMTVVNVFACASLYLM